MAKSAGTRGFYQRNMPITDKNIGKNYAKTALHEARWYKEGLARTEPQQIMTRQRKRRIERPWERRNENRTAMKRMRLGFVGWKR